MPVPSRSDERDQTGSDAAKRLLSVSVYGWSFAWVLCEDRMRMQMPHIEPTEQERVMEPKEVREALDRMEAGEASADVLATIVEGARAFATLEPEFVFKSPQTGLYYATRNDMLAETMLAAKPNERLLIRLAPPYPEWIAPNHTDGRES